jgi:hypothetical protein
MTQRYMSPMFESSYGSWGFASVLLGSVFSQRAGELCVNREVSGRDRPTPEVDYRALRQHVDGQDTTVLAHRFDHILTAVIGVRPDQL